MPFPPPRLATPPTTTSTTSSHLHHLVNQPPPQNNPASRPKPPKNTPRISPVFATSCPTFSLPRRSAATKPPPSLSPSSAHHHVTEPLSPATLFLPHLSLLPCIPCPSPVFSSPLLAAPPAPRRHHHRRLLARLRCCCATQEPNPISFLPSSARAPSPACSCFSFPEKPKSIKFQFLKPLISWAIFHLGFWKSGLELRKNDPSDGKYKTTVEVPLGSMGTSSGEDFTLIIST
ncbi:extensin-like [Spinacia oleracea]|uniref:Extensin-like n=1 Tax=Spinacia oleracea TaxID=3562 RepID=A0ABM3R5F9_SPIOL|nr:extensin-like [Spinacia oleracea]